MNKTEHKQFHHNSDWKISACPHDCPCGCSMRARFFCGEIEIEPYLSNPHTKFICAKGLRWRERALSPRRLHKPLLRDGANFREISWREAWDIWAKKIENAIAKHGALSLMYLTGAGSMYFSKTLMKSALAAIGGYTGTTGSLCAAVGYAGVKESKCGSALDAFVPPQTLPRAKGVLFWGKNVWETQPQLVPVLEEMKKNGSSLASIEIRETATTRESDRVWRVAPGGDWAIAAWLCKRILRSGRGDLRVTNAEEFEKFVKNLDDEMLLRESGFTREAAEELLQWLTAHAPVSHFPAYGAQRYLHGDLQFKWIFALCVLTGAFDNPAAGFAGGKDEHALFPSSLKARPEKFRTFPVGYWANHIGECDPPIEVLMIANANPLRQSPDTAAVMGAMSKIPFKVCSEIFMTETAEMCDLVFPTGTFLEDSDWLGSYWHSYLVRSEAVMPPLGESKSDVEIYDGLAKTLGLDIDLQAKLRDMDASILSDPRLKKIDENIYFWDEPNYWTDKNSRAELPTEIRTSPPNPLPMNGEGEYGAISPPSPFMEREGLGVGEVRLVTVHSGDYINGQSDDAPSVKTPPEIFMHPDTIEKMNLIEGNIYDFESLPHRGGMPAGQGGVLPFRVKKDASLSPDYAVAYQGQRGINFLTSALEAPGDGAPYAECFIRKS